MNDYSDDLSNYQGKGWPIEEEVFYGNSENLQEKVEFKDAQEDNADTWIFGYCGVGCASDSGDDALSLTLMA